MSADAVILADGDFPRAGGEARLILGRARRVVACDGAALAYRRRYRRWPDFTIGDFDSASAVPPGAVRMESQEENDLAKAIAFCRTQGWHDLVIVGATGRREDHTIGNIFRALAAQVKVVSDFGVFHPVVGSARLRAWKGAGVSVFTLDPKAKMSSKGLVWPLDGVKFSTPWRATLNRAASMKIEVVSSSPAFVYIESAKR